MKLPYGSYSKKGFRGSGMKLRRSEYFEYIYKGKSYFYKRKVYTSAYDGDIQYEKITKATFKRAITRGNKTETMYVDNDFEEIFFGTVAKVLADFYDIKVKYAREALENTLDTINELKKIYGSIDENFKSILFRQRIENFVEYVIPVKKMKEAI
ncbi:hypothetical protein [Senegalia massiliensis]|uniref:Uncharacterized protein n=1 Tax=Senegalia massiliensis TaxID=1720316 RepID=A0A845QXK9_9CLOT|nr:hypothetical protein [Senegalia massiliensis]NBI07215.1 hypothetical protein [Senegalia massiliensis]